MVSAVILLQILYPRYMTYITWKSVILQKAGIICCIQMNVTTKVTQLHSWKVKNKNSNVWFWKKRCILNKTLEPLLKNPIRSYQKPKLVNCILYDQQPEKAYVNII